MTGGIFRSKTISRIGVLALISIIFSQNFHAQNPKREFRGVWVATVANIDFPYRKGLNETEFTKEWEDLTDFYAERNFNAIIAQIRPVCDAFYPSNSAPWSEYYSGAQGVNREDNFDPLEMMVDVCRKKGLEFHAWLNPYRATMNTDVSNLHKFHPLTQYPEWGVQYGNRWYLNPALPEVRNYITEIIEELLINYDLDAIHFDDYFYPYKIAGTEFPDSLDYQKYGFGFYNIEDWRRHNTDELIKQVSKKIKAVSPHVKFGISPFGVWRNIDNDPVNGSNTRAGQTSYDDLFADILKWSENGWIDYVVPQLYWHIGHPAVDYETLINWWNERTFDRHLYIGQAAYKIANDSYENWNSRKETPNQILMSRATENVSGNVFFSSKPMRRNVLGVSDSLSQNYYRTKALLPEMTFLETEETAPPVLNKVKMRKGKMELKWTRPEKDLDDVYCVVYRFPEAKPEDFDNPENILTITSVSDKRNWKYTDDSFEKGLTYTYVISTVNRAHIESDLSNYRTIKVQSKGIQRIR